MNKLVSRISSRSSSATSLPSLNDDLPPPTPEIENDDENFDNSENDKIPLDLEEIPQFYKNFTSTHPMGQIFLRLASTNIELCRKANIKTKDTFDLQELCQSFTQAINLERTKLGSKVAKATANLEENLMDREFNFLSINQRI